MESKDRITIHHVLWYLVIFSIVGLIIETIFCYITTGVLESRKGLIIGPFCPIYGVGATILIIILNQFKESKIKVFIFGGLIGDLIEYTISYVLEAFYAIRFWDYSYTGTDLNGRICLTYTIFWTMLSVMLIFIVQPLIDKLINKVKFKHINKVEIAITIFIMLDCILTVWGLNAYENRAINKYNGTINENEDTSFIRKLENTIFNNEFMKKTFPNVRFWNSNNEEIWIKDIV